MIAVVAASFLSGPPTAPLLLVWARAEACAAWGGHGSRLPTDCVWSNRDGPSGAQPRAQGTPWLLRVEPAPAPAPAPASASAPAPASAPPPAPVAAFVGVEIAGATRDVAGLFDTLSPLLRVPTPSAAPTPTEAAFRPPTEAAAAVAAAEELVGYAEFNMTHNGMFRLALAAPAPAPAPVPPTLMPLAVSGLPVGAPPAWLAFVDGNGTAEDSESESESESGGRGRGGAVAPWALWYSRMEQHDGPQISSTEALYAVHGLQNEGSGGGGGGGGGGDGAHATTLFSRTATPAAATPAFGHEWALDAATRTLYTQGHRTATTAAAAAASEGEGISALGTAVGADIGVTALPADGAAAVPAPAAANSIPAHGVAFDCLHFDGGAGAGGGGRLGALRISYTNSTGNSSTHHQQTNVDLVSIDVRTGAVTTRLSIPAFVSFVPLRGGAAGDGAARCSFCRATGTLALLLADVDGAALPFAAVRALQLLTIDTRAVGASAGVGAAGAATDAGWTRGALSLPFGGGGDPGANRTWRPIDAGIGFAN